MDHQVSIILKGGDCYDIYLSATELQEFDSSSGRFFIGELFAESELEMPNPIGKVLLIDQVLLLAQEQKAAAWGVPDVNLKRFLAAAMQALDRHSMTIDLQNYKI